MATPKTLRAHCGPAFSLAISLLVFTGTAAPAAVNSARDPAVPQVLMQMIPFRPEGTLTVSGLEAQEISYLSDGLRVRGFLFLPPGDGRGPGIVFNHGGVSGVSKDMLRRSADLARAGYVVLTPAYRGEGGSEGRIEVADGEVTDVLTAAQILRGHPRVDPRSIALVGSSHGALISVLGATRDPRFAAVAAACGVMDVHAWYRYLVDNGFDVSDSLSVAVYGRGPEDRPEAFERRSAVRVAGRLDAPLLLQQGLKDRIVPPDQVWRMAAALERTGKTRHRVLTYPRLGHAFWFWNDTRSHSADEIAEADRSWQDLLAFLRHHLAGDGTPPPPSSSGHEVYGRTVEATGGDIDTAWVAEVERWRNVRVTRLTSETGWLSVAGLYWLEPGENRFGTAPDNDLVFPAGSAPDYAGFFRLATDGTVTIHVFPNAGVTHEGRTVNELRLTSDAEGTPELLALRDLRFFLIHRGKGPAVRLRDLNAPGRVHFGGIENYPIDAAWKFEARFVPYDSPKPVEIANIIGTTDTMMSPGYVEFERDGMTWRLDPVLEGPEETELFFIFKDGTSGSETYPPGRFLYADPPVDGRVILDFNRAYNPPCAFTDFATCPLPPPQNTLTLRVTAGEKRYGAH